MVREVAKSGLSVSLKLPPRWSMTRQPSDASHLNVFFDTSGGICCTCECAARLWKKKRQGTTNIDGTGHEMAGCTYDYPWAKTRERHFYAQCSSIVSRSEHYDSILFYFNQCILRLFYVTLTNLKSLCICLTRKLQAFFKWIIWTSRTVPNCQCFVASGLYSPIGVIKCWPVFLFVRL